MKKSDAVLLLAHLLSVLTALRAKYVAQFGGQPDMEKMIRKLCPPVGKNKHGVCSIDMITNLLQLEQKHGELSKMAFLNMWCDYARKREVRDMAKQMGMPLETFSSVYKRVQGVNIPWVSEPPKAGTVPVAMEVYKVDPQCFVIVRSRTILDRLIQEKILRPDGPVTLAQPADIGMTQAQVNEFFCDGPAVHSIYPGAYLSSMTEYMQLDPSYY